jgi:surfeit locus 1 family protein
MVRKIISYSLFIGALGILLSLGYWQIQRLGWKTQIINQLEREYAKDPIENHLTFDQLNNDKIQYGSIEGRFDYSKEILVGPKPYDGKIGYHVITPLKIGGGNVLVNRGWTEQNQTNISQPSGNIIITGIFRKPDWNSFTPNNSPTNNIWTKLDITQIATAKNIQNPAPVILYAESASAPFDNLIMQSQRWMPRNKHKQYAIFWFSMAGVLLAVFGFYRWQNRQRPS